MAGGSERYKIRSTKNHWAVYYLNSRIFPEDEEIDFNNCQNWLAWYGEHPVGFGSIKALPREPGSCIFTRAGILSKHTGNGLHNKLIDVRVRWAKKMGFKIIITYTLFNNIQSAANLERRGFRLYMPETKWAGEVLYFMRNL